MKTGKKLLSVLLAVVMLLSLGSSALANSPVDEDGWMRVPTSPDGLQKGDLWLDFSYLFAGRDDLTEEQLAEAVEIYNSATWYINFDTKRVMVESDYEELNGDQGVNQSMVWIHCVREIGVEWVKVKQSTVGIKVGDYYLDKDVFYQTAAEKTYLKFISLWEKESGQQIEDLSEEERAEVLASIADASATAGDMYWFSGFLYNPGGNLCVWCVGNMPAVIFFPFADSYVMIAAEAAQEALRQADEETVAASKWVAVAASIEDAEEGGYYIDFTEAAVMETFGLTEAPTEDTLAIFRNGEWYVDFERSVVAGTIVIDGGISEEENAQFKAMFGFSYPQNAFSTMEYPESEELFALLKYRPAPDWKPLPLDTDGLNDGDYYLDTDAFMAIIGRDKTEEECAAVLEQIRQHVVFYYNPDGVNCVFKYEYTELPVENSDPISGTVILPLDLEENESGATLFDYNALRNSVRQYSAVQPDEPETPSGNNNGTDIIGRFKAMIAAILSFFRKLFNNFSTNK